MIIETEEVRLKPTSPPGFYSEGDKRRSQSYFGICIWKARPWSWLQSVGPEYVAQYQNCLCHRKICADAVPALQHQILQNPPDRNHWYTHTFRTALPLLRGDLEAIHQMQINLHLNEAGYNKEWFVN